MNSHQKALESMFNDMDDFESKRIFSPEEGSGKGFSVTITMTPESTNEENKEADGINPMMGNLPSNENDAIDEMPEDVNAMNKGGIVADTKEPPLKRGETDDLTLPPFLRKKKK